MHCPNCGQRIPRGDSTICPNCRTTLKGPYGNEQHQLDGKEFTEGRASLTHLTRYTYVAILGVSLLLFGYGVVFFFPFPSPSNAIPSTPYEDLLDLAIVSAISGLALVFFSAVRAALPSSKENKGSRMSVTLFSAMRSGIALPTWWKWWYSGIPVVVLTIIQVETRFSLLVYWGLVLGYSGTWLAYVYFVSKRWVEGRG